MECMVHIRWDDEAKTWIAFNDYLPLAMESDSLDRLMDKVRNVIPELVELNHLEKPRFIYFLAENREEVSV